MMNELFTLREIQIGDNPFIAKVIREVLTEYGGNRPGTAYFDYDTDHMFEAYSSKGQVYFVAEYKARIVGGSGVKRLKGAGTEFCELQKLYLIPEVRGLGIGKRLTQKCLDFAAANGYQKCYLETFPNMLAAISLYEKLGFKRLGSPIGDTGHGGCDIWMLKDL